MPLLFCDFFRKGDLGFLPGSQEVLHLFFGSLHMEGEGDNSEVRTSAIGVRGSYVAHSQDIGRPAFIFPPLEVKFDGGNIFEWYKMITLTLNGCQLGDHLTEVPKPVTDPEYKKWKAEESLILSWMLRSMTPEMRRDFLCCDSAKEMWDDIQKYNEEKTHHWRIYELNMQASRAGQEGDNVLQYASKLKAIWREINYLWAHLESTICGAAVHLEVALIHLPHGSESHL